VAQREIRIWNGVQLVRDLSVLTPPALMAIACIVAIVAFLRHEMGPASGADDDNTDDELIADDETDPDHAGSTDADFSDRN
jgi:hypothetical protein